MAVSAEWLSDLGDALSAIRPPAVEAEATQSGVAISRYVEGLTGEMQLRGELQALGYGGKRADRLVLAAKLRRQLELYRDMRTLWRAQLAKGQLTDSQYATLLESAGVPGQTILDELALTDARPPAQVLQAVQMSLEVVSATESPPAAVASPVALSLEIIAADEVPGPLPPGDRVALSLEIIAADEVPALPTAQPVALSLDLIAYEEA